MMLVVLLTSGTVVDDGGAAVVDGNVAVVDCVTSLLAVENDAASACDLSRSTNRGLSE